MTTRHPSNATAPYRLAHREDRRGFRGMAMQLTKYEYEVLKNTHKADTKSQLWVLQNGLATRELEVEDDCVKDIWWLTEPGKAAVAEYEAALRYPLWCVDFGVHLDERRYRGPFDEREPAEVCASKEWHEEDEEPTPVVRRCRRLLVSEVLGRANLGSRAEDFATLLDEDGVEPENRKAWADWEDSVLDAEEGIRDALVEVIDRFVSTSVFICEGDE